MHVVDVKLKEIVIVRREGTVGALIITGFVGFSDMDSERFTGFTDHWTVITWMNPVDSTLRKILCMLRTGVSFVPSCG